ncbi:MAG: GntR family transcriptional regulator [Solirubrobacteraceae bacterium]
MASETPTWGLNVVERLSTTAQVLAELRGAIVSGRIGPGVHLREMTLAQTLGTGRSAIREAIRQLVQEGLVEYVLNRGAYVRRLTAEDCHDVYRAREVIEVSAVQWALAREPAPSLASLTAAFERIVAAATSAPADQPASAQLIAADLDFHRELVWLSGSPRLSRAHETLAAEAQMLMHHQPVYPLTDYAADHTVLLETIARRDPAAPERVRDHLRLSDELIVSEIMRMSGVARDRGHPTGGEVR